MKKYRITELVEKHFEPTMENINKVQQQKDKLIKLTTSIETQCKVC